MYIVHIASELAPVAKVGGLADVVYGLSRELEVRGNDVEIILPKYDCLWYEEIWGLHTTYEDLWVPWFAGSIHCTVYSGSVHGRKCYFIEPHSNDNFFNRGAFYGASDDIMRFAFFSRAAMEFLLKSGKRPNIIHCHDWQTGLVPVLLWEIYHRLGMHDQRVVYTIHNFQHQGVHGELVMISTCRWYPMAIGNILPEKGGKSSAELTLRHRRKVERMSETDAERYWKKIALKKIGAMQPAWTPIESTLPNTQSSTALASTPDRSINAWIACPPMSAGWIWDRPPPRRPTGVRTASTMNASDMPKTVRARPGRDGAGGGRDRTFTVASSVPVKVPTRSWSRSSAFGTFAPH